MNRKLVTSFLFALVTLSCAAQRASAPGGSDDPKPATSPSKPRAQAAQAPEEARAEEPQAELDYKRMEGASKAQSPAEEAISDQLEAETAEEMPALSRLDEQEELFSARTAFAEAMNPEYLSCQGAIPFRDAICAIAERLCKAQTPTISSQKDCRTARESCDLAKQEYARRCGD